MADTKKVAEEIKTTATKIAGEAKTTASKASAAAKTTATKATTAAKKASTTAKKTATKKAAAKKKAEPTKSVILQFAGEDFKIDDIVEKAKDAFKAENKRKAVDDIKVYLKPEDRAAYYVVKSGESEYAGQISL